MAKQETVNVNDQEFTLQSVSPSWYMDNLDRFGRGKNTKKYMDELIRNVVVAPPEVNKKGVKYFDEREDLSTASALLEEIESFLGRPDKSGGGKTAGDPK